MACLPPQGGPWPADRFRPLAPTAWFPPTELDSPNWSPRLLPCPPASKQRLDSWDPRDNASGQLEGVDGGTLLWGPSEPSGDMVSSGREGKSSELGLGVAPLSAERMGGGGGRWVSLCVRTGGQHFHRTAPCPPGTGSQAGHCHPKWDRLPPGGGSPTLPMPWCPALSCQGCQHAGGSRRSLWGLPAGG